MHFVHPHNSTRIQQFRLKMTFETHFRDMPLTYEAESEHYEVGHGAVPQGGTCSMTYLPV